MVKHTQAIRRVLPTNCLSVFDHFVELALKGLRSGKKVVMKGIERSTVRQERLLRLKSIMIVVNFR